jgi:hypothetical protein
MLENMVERALYRRNPNTNYRADVISTIGGEAAQGDKTSSKATLHKVAFPRTILWLPTLIN